MFFIISILTETDLGQSNPAVSGSRALCALAICFAKRTQNPLLSVTVTQSLVHFLTSQAQSPTRCPLGCSLTDIVYRQQLVSANQIWLFPVSTHCAHYQSALWIGLKAHFCQSPTHSRSTFWPLRLRARLLDHVFAVSWRLFLWENHINVATIPYYIYI